MFRRDEAIDRLRMVPLFATCTPKELARIDSLSARVTVKSGMMVAKQGARGREFIVIVSGTATVERDGVVVAHLGCGDYFGEIALFASGPRTATVTAQTDLVVGAFSRDEFRRLLDASPGLAATIHEEATRRQLVTYSVMAGDPTSV